MKYICLSIYCNIRGFAYSCVEMPNKLLDYAVITRRPYDVERLLVKVRKLLDFYQPTILVLRDANSVDSVRMRKFINEITECAVASNVQVHQYSKEQVKEVFDKFGVSSKNEIADYIILQWLPELSERRPQQRSWYEPEDYHMGVFDSLALTMTHEFKQDVQYL